MKKLLSVVLLAFAAAGSIPAANAAQELMIAAKSNDGSIIKLEDGSIFEVDSVDRIDSSLWIPGDDVVLTDDEDQLFNPSDESSVSVVRVK